MWEKRLENFFYFKVRSLFLDFISEDQVEEVKRVGNRKFNSLLEKDIKSKPSPEDDIEVKHKYVLLKYKHFYESNDLKVKLWNK